MYKKLHTLCLIRCTVHQISLLACLNKPIFILQVPIESIPLPLVPSEKIYCRVHLFLFEKPFIIRSIYSSQKEVPHKEVFIYFPRGISHFVAHSEEYVSLARHLLSFLMSVRRVFICSARWILIYHHDLRGRCLLWSARRILIYYLFPRMDPYFYAPRVRRSSLILPETDHMLPSGNLLYSARLRHVPCSTNHVGIPSLLRRWNLYPFTHAYILRDTNLVMDLHYSLSSRELVPFLEVHIPVEDIKDLYLFLRPWFLHQGACTSWSCFSLYGAWL